MSEIHPSALVSPGARIGRDAVIGPFCVIGPGVILGERCRLHNNVTLTGHATIGAGNEFFPNVVIGAPPQDLKYHGGMTRVEIGDRNIFREGVTVHAGTEVGGGVTRVGSDGLFCVGVHVAHDVTIGNRCVIANCVQFAGHVHVEDCCNIGGLAAFHHFVTVGRYAYVGGMSRVVMDVPPFTKFAGYRAKPRAINAEGLRRWGFEPDAIRSLKRTYSDLFGRRAELMGGSLAERLARIENNGELTDEQAVLCRFVRRSLCEGVYGRYLETLRADSDADRKRFYDRKPDPMSGGRPA
jgi:UDP-N-acetylglucosamine acyltransferase